MGVSCVFLLDVPEGKTGQQLTEHLQKKIEFLSGEKCGSWSMDCETYQAAQNLDPPSKLIHLLHSSDYPLLTFSVLENNLCLAAENSLDSLLSKLKLFYTPRKSGKIEAKGTKYVFGDFIVKLGNVTQQSSFKGVIAEVIYEPCSDVVQCWNLLKEFINYTIDKNIKLPEQPRSVVDKKQGLFTASDTMLQYVETLSLNKKT